MKLPNVKFSRRSPLLAVPIGLLGAASWFSGVQAAVAPAGTPIENQALVEYEDSAGNPFNATSAPATVLVAQVYGATLGDDDLTKTAGLAQTVYFTHTITNNGNGSDVFHVSIAQNAAGSTDDSDFTNLQVFLDGSATASGGTVVSNDCSGTNGQVDTGEVLLDNTTTAGVDGVTVTVPQGQQACLVIAAQVPASGIANGETLEYTVTAEAEGGNAGTPQANSVGDFTDGDGSIGGGANGLDALDGTNNGRVTVTSDAALQISKSAVHTPATATTDGQIDYTVTLQNTGAATANEVFLFDGIPAGTTLVASSVLFNNTPSATGDDFLQTTALDLTEVALDGAVAANVNPVDLNGDGDSTDATEVDLGLDLDRDGVTDAVNKQGVFVYDHEVLANSTITLKYSVTYPASLASGTQIINTAHYSGDLNGDGNSSGTGETNSTGDIPVTTQPVIGVTLDDTAGDGDPVAIVNDGLDDDAVDDDVQTVNASPEAGTVIFNNVVTNTGNITETYDLNFINDGGAAWNTATGFPFPAALAGFGGAACDGTAGSQFPPGSSVSFTNTAGVPLSGDQVTVAAGASTTIQVRVQLPSGVNGAGEYCGSMEVQSQTDGTILDYALERLASIETSAVDLANTNNSALTGDTEAFVATTSVVNQVGALGNTVSFDLFIRNDGGAGESYALTAGSSWTGGAQGSAGFAAGVLGAIPPGWSVTFEDNDPSTTTADGTVITSTDTIPAGGTIQVRATVTIPADASLAQADFLSDADGNAATELLDGNADGDGDYPFIFRIVGNNSGASDVILDTVDVDEVENITVSAPQTGQVEPGGTITYTHTLANEGNTTESVVLSVGDSRDGDPATEPADFDPTVLRVDTDCDGVVDTPLAAITGTSANICLVGDAPGTPTGNYNSATGEITLNPGDQVNVVATVSAQTSAASGVTNTTTLTATWDVGVDDDTATLDNLTTVVRVQLRIVKTVARDAACDGTPDEAFTENAATATAPGECVIWNMVVENQSSNAARNVRVIDAEPGAFSIYEVGSLESCNADAGTAATDLSTACTSAAGDYCLHTEAVDDEAGCASTHDASESGGNVIFYVGHADGANPAPDGVLGGTLLGGEIVTVRFRIQVDNTN